MQALKQWGGCHKEVTSRQVCIFLLTNAETFARSTSSNESGRSKTVQMSSAPASCHQIGLGLHGQRGGEGDMGGSVPLGLR